MKENKKVRYVKIRDDDYRRAPKKVSPAEKGQLTGGQAVRKSLSIVGTTLAALILIVVITICIVAVAFTVYIMQFAESTFDVDLRDVELSYNSYVYAYDKDNKEVEIKRLSSDQNRVWVNISEVPEHVRNAVIAVEDQRFMDHDGVDWKRTISATVSALVSTGNGGGSTITQQLVRDITKDNDVNIGRKLREIFRAMQLEQKYTKFDILESYLNRISFGGTTYGIGSAALHYFDKPVSELTIAEGAILAGIIRSPSNYNPYASLKQAKTRQMYALKHMYAQGYITSDEYEVAIAEQVKFRRPVKGTDFGYTDERYNDYYGIISDNKEEDLYYKNESWADIADDIPYKWNGDYEVTQNWYVDAGINQVVEDLAIKKMITKEEARELVHHGGYKIYLNMDIDMQNKLTEKFKDPYLCLTAYNPSANKKNLIQAAFVIMDYRGNVKAISGGLGDKEGDNCFNRATQSIRAVGSTIKPLTVYSLAVEQNLINYSTMMRDQSGKIKVEKDSPLATPANGYDEKEGTVRWPHNYQETGFGSGNYYPAWYAVQKSMNTVAVRVLNMLGLNNAFTHLTNRLGIDTLDPVNDMSYSPLALGALTKGIRLIDLAAAYQIMGNGGVYYEPYFYSKVVDSAGKVVLDQNVSGLEAIGSDTAWITNRMMKTVADDQYGTGKFAKIDGIEVVCKTGTANDMSNLAFVGLTPQYVGAYRIGYDDNHEVGKGDGWKTLGKVWHDVMVDLVPKDVEQQFTPDSGVVSLKYCTETGLLATSKCPQTAIGYYKQDALPLTCFSKHDGSYWKEYEHEKPILY